jgi:ketosteroid isomerase-like protein
MEMHVGRKLVLVAIALAMAVLAARSFWFSDARVIRRRLGLLAEVASGPANETDVERTARMARLGTFFTDDCVLRKDVSSFVGGRQAVLGLAFQGVAAYGRMTVSLADVQVAMSDPATATAYMTLRVSGDQGTALEPRQLSATLVKVNGEWLVSRGEVLRTLDAAK